MTISEITKTLKCSRQTALTMLSKAGMNPVSVPFSHGKKYFYEVTPESLLEVRRAQQRDPVQIASQQAAALSAIESVFPCRSGFR